MNARGGGAPKRKTRSALPAPAASPVPPRPELAEEIPLFMRLEREVEEVHRPQMLKALEERVRGVAEGLKGHPPSCLKCTQPMKRKRTRMVSWLCRFGRVRAEAESYRCKPCRQTRRPLVEALGVEVGRITGSLARLLCLLGTVVPYELASQLAHDFLGVRVSAMTIWRCVQRLGEACDRHDRALSAHHGHPESEEPPVLTPADVVMLGVDGCALGMQVRERRRRFQTPEECQIPLPAVEEGHFREVKTGVIFRAEDRVEPSPGRRSVMKRVLVTCLGGADAVFGRLWARLQELAWIGPQTTVVILGDGAEWIWNRAALMFPNRCEILDLWHAVEKAWEFARLHYGEGSRKTARWAHQLARDLKAGKVEQVIKRLSLLQPKTPASRKALKDLIRYYVSNQTRMRYDQYLRLGYGIGSGAVESSHKQVVHARLRQAGMRWSEAGAQRLLALRVTLLNGDWDKLDRLTMVRFAA